MTGDVRRPCETRAVTASALTALFLVTAVAGCSYWVLQDARARTERGRPVAVVLIGLTIEDPQVWAALCLLLSVIFVPLYLVARRAHE